MKLKYFTLFVLFTVFLVLILLPIHIDSVYNNEASSTLFGGDSVNYYNKVFETGFSFNRDSIGAIFSIFGILVITDLVRSVAGDLPF